MTRKIVKLAAADSTGLETHHCSKYFTNRRKNSGKQVIYKRFPKFSIIVNTKTHMKFSDQTMNLLETWGELPHWVRKSSVEISFKFINPSLKVGQSICVVGVSKECHWNAKILGYALQPLQIRRKAHFLLMKL